MKKITAPELDALLNVSTLRSFNPVSYDDKVKEKLNELYILLDKIKPIGDDELKILYFSVEKGTIDDYGDYEELKEFGEVSSYEEFENNFIEEYPDEIYWYQLVTTRYKNYRTISINQNCVFCADMDTTNNNFENVGLQELLDILIYKVKEIIKQLEDNTYNDYVYNNLSYKKRFGVIKRSDYWKLYPDVKKNLLSYITQEEIDDFINNATEKVNERITNMTSGKYFECVRLAYQNNDYEIGELSDKELYLKYADGRDEGLSKIDLNSSEEFDKWYNDDDKFGGHPWEIIRGHSFARVNLYISHDDNGYYLVLDGRKILRKIEIAKIYLALRKNNIPIEIHNVDVLKNAFSGNDYIGVVPSNILPIECGGYFNNYKPLEFVHIEDEKILDHIIWEDIEKIYLK